MHWLFGSRIEKKERKKEEKEKQWDKVFSYFDRILFSINLWNRRSYKFFTRYDIFKEWIQMNLNEKLERYLENKKLRDLNVWKYIYIYKILKKE